MKIKKQITKDFLNYTKKLRLLDKDTYIKKIGHLVNLDIFNWGNTQYEKYKHILENEVIVEDYEEYKSIFSHDLKIDQPHKTDLHFEVDIKLGRALKHNTIPIVYNQIAKCPECTNLKTIPTEAEKCPKCLSTGRVQKEPGVQSICVCCHGYGYLKSQSLCEVCRDKLVYLKTNKVDLTLGDEFHEGIVYSFPNMGNYNLQTNRYGSLHIKPYIVDDHSSNGKVLLKVINGTQVESEEKVPVSTMTMGGSFNVSHASGECEVILEPATQPGEYRVIGNIGIPQYYDNEEKEMQRGSQIVYFNAKLPSKKELAGDRNLRNLFEQLSKYDDLVELNKPNRVNL